MYATWRGMSENNDDVMSVVKYVPRPWFLTSLPSSVRFMCLCKRPVKLCSKKGSHVYLLLQVFWVILLFCHKCCSDVTIVQSDIKIVVPWQLSTGSKHDYLFCYCPLLGILFEVLRIVATQCQNTIHIMCTMYQMVRL